MKLHDASRVPVGWLADSDLEPAMGSVPLDPVVRKRPDVCPRRESHVHAAMAKSASEQTNRASVTASSGGELGSLDTVVRSFEVRSGVHIDEAIVTSQAPLRACYENLKVNLWTRFPDKPMRAILVVGATSGCGVSTVAANLAASLAQDSGTRVLLIDADVRFPKPLVVTASSPEENSAGKSLERLLSDTTVWQQPTGSSNLFVLGAKCAMPLAVFRSEAFTGFLCKMREFFDYVVIDAPPLASNPETLLLSRKTDGVLLVVESEKTRKQTALRAKKQIETSGGTLLGVVLSKRRFRVPQWLYRRI